MHIPFLSAEAPFALLAMALSALILFRHLPTLRRSLTNTAVFFGICLCGDLLAGVLDGSLQPGLLRWIRELAVFGEGLAVVRYLGLAMFRVVLVRLHIQVSGILLDILVIAGYILWGFIRLNLAGVEFTALFATSAIVTAVLAISMQETLGNLLGGLALQMDNSLEIGDWIEMENLAGQVTDIQWRYTTILMRNGAKMVVPNSQLMRNRYAVICDHKSQPTQQRRSISFNVDLSIPPSRVIDTVLHDIQAATIPNVSLFPAPQCLLTSFGAGYVTYELRYWLIDPGPDAVTDSDIRRHILASLQRAGIRLALSDRIVHLVQQGKRHRKDVNARELQRRLDAIARIELFAKLSDEEKLELARHLINSPFAKGDIMTQQGAVAHWLYIIVSGEAEAWWQPPDGGAAHCMDKEHLGSVFGELGLMTGEPRRATVIALTDVEAYRLDKAGFEKVIRARPELAEGISGLLEQHLAHFQTLEREYTQSKLDDLVGHRNQSAALSKRIRDFFGL